MCFLSASNRPAPHDYVSENPSTSIVFQLEGRPPYLESARLIARQPCRKLTVHGELITSGPRFRDRHASPGCYSWPRIARRVDPNRHSVSGPLLAPRDEPVTKRKWRNEFLGDSRDYQWIRAYTKRTLWILLSKTRTPPLSFIRKAVQPRGPVDSLGVPPRPRPIRLDPRGKFETERRLGSRSHFLLRQLHTLGFAESHCIVCIRVALFRIASVICFERFSVLTCLFLRRLCA
jgi:hypothetical protein